MDEADAKTRDLARIAEQAALTRERTPGGGSAPSRAPSRDCGHFDIHIDRDGSWFHQGTPINRASLVRLFSTVLERDADGVYWLATPVERGRIAVADVPFLAVELDRRGDGPGQELVFRTNVGDFVTADAEHKLRVAMGDDGAPRPYVDVRNGLEARLARPVFYALVELGREERVGDTTLFGVWSKNTFFPLGSLAEPA